MGVKSKEDKAYPGKGKPLPSRRRRTTRTKTGQNSEPGSATSTEDSSDAPSQLPVDCSKNSDTMVAIEQALTSDCTEPTGSYGDGPDTPLSSSAVQSAQISNLSMGDHGVLPDPSSSMFDDEFFFPSQSKNSPLGDASWNLWDPRWDLTNPEIESTPPINTMTDQFMKNDIPPPSEPRPTTLEQILAGLVLKGQLDKRVELAKLAKEKAKRKAKEKSKRSRKKGGTTA